MFLSKHDINCLELIRVYVIHFTWIFIAIISFRLNNSISVICTKILLQIFEGFRCRCSIKEIFEAFGVRCSIMLIIFIIFYRRLKYKNGFLINSLRILHIIFVKLTLWKNIFIAISHNLATSHFLGLITEFLDIRGPIFC